MDQLMLDHETRVEQGCKTRVQEDSERQQAFLFAKRQKQLDEMAAEKQKRIDEIGEEEYNLEQMEGKKEERDRKARAREANGKKIEKKAKRNEMQYTKKVTALGLFAFPIAPTCHTRSQIRDKLLQSLLSMKTVHVIDDIIRLIVKTMRFMMEAAHSNEIRGDSPSRDEGWTKTTKRAQNIATLQVVVSEEGMQIARERTIGNHPIVMFVLTHRGFVRADGPCVRTTAVYFGVKLPDHGIKARLTHGLPSAWYKVNEIASVEKIVGFNSEPLISRGYPHSMELDSWTVFRIPPSVIKDSTKEALWMTFYDANGLIGTRPVLFTKKYLEWDTAVVPTDIATLSPTGRGLVVGGDYIDRVRLRKMIGLDA